MVVEMVQEIRHKMPRIGTRKMYFLLHKELQQVGKIGRDKFFDLLRKNELLIARKKSYTRTTDSYHRFHKYNNLLYNKDIVRPNQCWVSDITYIRTLNGFVYLFLITDYYSRKIVGWSLSHSLSIEGGLLALQMAVKQRHNHSGLIHHSDRGIQYCSGDYVKMLQKNGIQISMTEQNHCYENAKAERVNGILKDEFLLDSTFNDFSIAQQSVRQAIKTYNEIRPHWSLNLQTPTQVHAQVA
jgi:transposase InsO family protein